jgi:hypothetical protein
MHELRVSASEGGRMTREELAVETPSTWEVIIAALLAYGFFIGVLSYFL